MTSIITLHECRRKSRRGPAFRGSHLRIECDSSDGQELRRMNSESVHNAELSSISPAVSRDTPIGPLPVPDALDTTGLTVPADDLATLLSIDPSAWHRELDTLEAYSQAFGERLPASMLEELAETRKRLRRTYAEPSRNATGDVA
jgi:phosphoenolpyruvate carboxykinase-like protein